MLAHLNALLSKHPLPSHPTLAVTITTKESQVLLALEDGAVHLGASYEKAAATVSTDAETVAALIAGRLTALGAVMRGKLSFSGDRKQLAPLQQWATKLERAEVERTFTAVRESPDLTTVLGAEIAGALKGGA